MSIGAKNAANMGLFYFMLAVTNVNNPYPLSVFRKFISLGEQRLLSF
jgi:hypothetical protein